MSGKSKLEQIVAGRLRSINIEFQEEYKFHPTRRWRFDFALIKEKIAIECEGGVWVGGRHNRGSGFVKDVEKYNTATSIGWRVFRFTTSNLDTLVPILREALSGQ